MDNDNNSEEDDSYGFILHPNFHNLMTLTLPISLGHAWLDRKYYKIRLINSAASSGHLVSCNRQEYEVKLNFNGLVPMFLHDRTLNFVFREIFFIITHNSLVPHGNRLMRLSLVADSLKEPANLAGTFLDEDSIRLLLDKIKALQQSNEDLLVDESLRIYFNSCKFLR